MNDTEYFQLAATQWSESVGARRQHTSLSVGRPRHLASVFPPSPKRSGPSQSRSWRLGPAARGEGARGAAGRAQGPTEADSWPRGHRGAPAPGLGRLQPAVLKWGAASRPLAPPPTASSPLAEPAVGQCRRRRSRMHRPGRPSVRAPPPPPPPPPRSIGPAAAAAHSGSAGLAAAAAGEGPVAASAAAAAATAAAAACTARAA